MFKVKKVFAALCAVALIASSGTAVYADSWDSVSGYLPSCGSVDGFSCSWQQSGVKYVKAETSSTQNAYRIRADMTAVNRQTGVTLASGVQQMNNYDYACALRTVNYNTSVTVFGSHQVWGTGNEYWGAFVTVYD